MTKNEIIADIKWRINDYKERFKFAIDKQEQYIQEKKDLEISVNTLSKRFANGNADEEQIKVLKDKKQRLNGINSQGGVDNDISRYHEQAYRCLVATDTLERLLETIQEDEHNEQSGTKS